jgi:hypothetical protein
VGKVNKTEAVNACIMKLFDIKKVRCEKNVVQLKDIVPSVFRKLLIRTGSIRIGTFTSVAKRMGFVKMTIWVRL